MGIAIANLAVLNAGQPNMPVPSGFLCKIELDATYEWAEFFKCVPSARILMIDDEESILGLVNNLSVR